MSTQEPPSLPDVSDVRLFDKQHLVARGQILAIFNFGLFGIICYLEYTGIEDKDTFPSDQNWYRILAIVAQRAIPQIQTFNNSC